MTSPNVLYVSRYFWMLIGLGLPPPPSYTLAFVLKKYRFYYRSPHMKMMVRRKIGEKS